MRRNTQGDDIAAACGQLAIKENVKIKNERRKKRDKENNEKTFPCRNF